MNIVGWFNRMRFGILGTAVEKNLRKITPKKEISVRANQIMTCAPTSLIDDLGMINPNKVFTYKFGEEAKELPTTTPDWVRKELHIQ